MNELHLRLASGRHRRLLAVRGLLTVMLKSWLRTICVLLRTEWRIRPHVGNVLACQFLRYGPSYCMQTFTKRLQVSCTRSLN